MLVRRGESLFGPWGSLRLSLVLSFSINILSHNSIETHVGTETERVRDNAYEIESYKR